VGEGGSDGGRPHHRVPARPRALLVLLRAALRHLRGKRPNGAHRALVELERRGLLAAVVTQNIDGLHGEAGTRELIEVHGSIATSSCPACGAAFPLEVVRARLEAAADGVPRCDCGEPLKPDVVLFGEFLPEAALERAQALAASAGLLLCIGSSLEVHPVAQLRS
jgi:NAD-dependent deacetylase